MSTIPAIGPSQSDPEILRATGDWTLKHASRLLELIEAAISADVVPLFPGGLFHVTS